MAPALRGKRPGCSRRCSRSPRKTPRVPAPAEALRHGRAQPFRVEGAVRRVGLDAARSRGREKMFTRPAHRVVSEEARGRPADDLDPLDGPERRLVPGDVPVDRVVQRHAVQQDEGPVAAEAAHRDVVRRRLDRVAAPEREVQADDVPEGVVERPGRRVLDRLARDDGHAHRDVLGGPFASGGGDDDAVGPNEARFGRCRRRLLCKRPARRESSEESQRREPGSTGTRAAGA